MVISRPLLVALWAVLPVIHFWALWPVPAGIVVVFCLLWYGVGPLVYSLDRSSGLRPPA